MPEECTEVKIPNTELVFSVCVNALGLKITHDGKEATVSLRDFNNMLALRAILHSEFGIDLNDQLSGYCAFFLQENKEVNALLRNRDPPIPNPSVCVKYNDRYEDCEKEISAIDGGLILSDYAFTDNKQANRVRSSHCYVVLGSMNKIRKIQLKGVNLKENLIKLDINNASIIGTLEEVINALKNYALDQTKKQYVSQFLLQNATIPEDMYYSAGPWVVDGKVEIAETGGYMPQWKESVRYKLPDVGDPARGIASLSNIVNSYKNPSKAMTVISFGVIAWAKYFFVENFQYFPHLVILGPNETGKSLLVDVLRTMYSFVEEERSPKSDFQLRKLLAKTTVPGMLTEGNFLVSFTQTNDKLLATLTASATTNIVSESGSSEYGGLFLAVRTLIIPTNLDVESLAGYVRDKMIILNLTKEDGYTDDKNIKTPRRMTRDEKNDMASIMKEVYNRFSGKLKEISEKLSTANREDAIQFYIKLGYSILKEIADQYGVSLPEPFIPSLNDSDEDFNEVVRGGFLQFIEEKKQELLRNASKVTYEAVDFIDPSYPKDVLDRYGFFIDTKNSLIIFNMSLLTEYSMEMTKKYGLPKLSWRSIAEILGVKRTRVSRYGQKLDNVFEYTYMDQTKAYCKSLDGKPMDPNSNDIELCREIGYYDAENQIFRVFE